MNYCAITRHSRTHQSLLLAQTQHILPRHRRIPALAILPMDRDNRYRYTINRHHSILSVTSPAVDKVSNTDLIKQSLQPSLHRRCAFSPQDRLRIRNLVGQCAWR